MHSNLFNKLILSEVGAIAIQSFANDLSTANDVSAASRNRCFSDGFRLCLAGQRSKSVMEVFGGAELSQS